MSRLRCPLTLALLAAFTAGCYDEAAQAPMPNITAPPVEAVQARFGGLPLVERLSGTVRADNQVSLYPELSGRITAVRVQDGDSVTAGQILVEINADPVREQLRQAEAGLRIGEARVRQAKARLAELQAQAQRTRSLGARELVSALELDTIAAQVESAAADVALAEAQREQNAATLAEQQDLLNKAFVRSPIDGVVGQRNAEVGMQASPSTRLFTVGNVDRVKVRVNVTDNMLRYLEAGQRARITLPAPGGGRLLTAEVSRISPFLNEVTRTTEAEIEIANEGRVLRPGMFVPVDILYGQSQQATLVPTSALFTDPDTGQSGIFVLTGTVTLPAVGGPAPPPLSEPVPVEFRPVALIARGAMEVAVSGVAAGDWVVTLGQDLLSTGRSQARVRAVTWDHVMTLQGLKREDLLDAVLQPDAPSPAPGT